MIKRNVPNRYASTVVKPKIRMTRCGIRELVPTRGREKSKILVAANKMTAIGLSFSVKIAD